MAEVDKQKQAREALYRVALAAAGMLGAIWDHTKAADMHPEFVQAVDSLSEAIDNLFSFADSVFVDDTLRALGYDPDELSARFAVVITKAQAKARERMEAGQ